MKKLFISIISDILDIPMRLKLRYNEAFVKLRGVPRCSPDNDDNFSSPPCVEEKEESFSIVKPDIKIVGKIDLDSLNQRTRPEKKSKRQLAEERRERAIKSGKKSKKQLAQERNERLGKSPIS